MEIYFLFFPTFWHRQIPFRSRHLCISVSYKPLDTKSWICSFATQLVGKWKTSPGNFHLRACNGAHFNPFLSTWTNSQIISCKNVKFFIIPGRVSDMFCHSGLSLVVDNYRHSVTMCHTSGSLRYCSKGLLRLDGGFLRT